jgi:hypothetical protein
MVKTKQFFKVIVSKNQTFFNYVKFTFKKCKLYYLLFIFKEK